MLQEQINKEKHEMVQLMNKNMLTDDKLWDILAEDEKRYQCE